MQGPLIIPGPTLFGTIDFRLTTFRYRNDYYERIFEVTDNYFGRSMIATVFLKLFDRYDPELVLGYANLSVVTSDEDMQRRLSEDPLRWTGGCKVRLLLAFVRCLQNHLYRLGEIKVPLLILHGQNDSLCNAEGSRMLYEAAAAVDKQLYEYEGAVHQLYLEKKEVRELAAAKTVEWISSRAKARTRKQGVNEVPHIATIKH